MQIKGSVEIRVIDSRSQELKQVVKQNNLITNNTLINVLDWDSNHVGYYVGRDEGRTKISISTSTQQPSINNATLTNIIATGYIPQGIDSPVWNQAVNPPFGQIQNRIDFIGTQRTFNSVGLTNYYSGNNQNNSASAVAYLKLDTPCTQGAYDYLDIFYRIQFLNSDGQGFSNRALKDFGGRFFSKKEWEMHYLFVNPCICPSKTLGYTDLTHSRYSDYYHDTYDLIINAIPRYNYDNEWDGGYRIDNHFKWKYYKNWELEERVGWIFNLMMQGKSADQDAVYTWKPLTQNSSPFQNLFTHSSNATKPFFDSLALASGNGKVLLNGKWNKKLPEMYKFTIVSEGATGTATYKWSRRKHLGFDANNYSDRAVGCPFRNPYTPAAPKMHGYQYENNDVLRYSNTQIVQYDDGGVTLLDIFDGTYINWDKNTTPALPVTQARQCAVDTAGKKIYVACRNTGLWVIDIAANTITNPYNVGCYGVDVGRNGVAYFVVNGGLYSSVDFSTPLNFSYTGISDNNWSKVYYLKVDPEHTEDRLAIVMQPPTAGNRRVVWWQAQPYRTTTATSYNAAVLENDLAVYLRLGETTGTVANDSSGKGNTGTYFNCTLNTTSSLAGDNNPSVSFNGSTSRIGTATKYTNPQIFSLEARFKTSAAVTQGIFGFSSYQDTTTSNHDRQIYLDSNGKVNFRVYDGSVRILTSANTYNNNQWHSVVATFDRGDMRLYVNGLLVANAPVGNAENYSGWWHIGYAPGVANSFNGSLDEPAIYNVALSEQSVLDHYNLAQGNQLSSLPTTKTGIESSSLKPWSAAMDVSDTGSFWVAGNLGRLNYGSGNINRLDINLCHNYFTHSIWGVDYYFKIAFYKNFLIGRDKIVDDANRVQNSYNYLNERSFLLHMDGGIVLTNREMRQLFTDNIYCWENYGWDGQAWILNGTAAKTTHTSEQSLVDELTIKFQDGASTPHFTATDYYTQGLCYGNWKDNATTIYYESAWYSKPAQFDYPVQAGLTVPATPSNAPPAATRYWRLRNLTSSTGGTDGYWGYREIIFRNEAGTDITSGGTSSASHNSNIAFRAFDKNTGNVWDGERYGQHWIQYTFATSVVVYSISINGYIPYSNYGMPTDYVLEYSVDNSKWQSAYEFKTSITSDNIYYNIDHQYNTAYNAILGAANESNFVRIETDSVELTKLTLDGQPLATTYVEAGIPPAPNEAVIFGDGRVKFNSADAGKAIAGTYAYIKN